MLFPISFESDVWLEERIPIKTFNGPPEHLCVLASHENQHNSICLLFCYTFKDLWFERCLEYSA